MFGNLLNFYHKCFLCTLSFCLIYFLFLINLKVDAKNDKNHVKLMSNTEMFGNSGSLKDSSSLRNYSNGENIPATKMDLLPGSPRRISENVVAVRTLVSVENSDNTTSSNISTEVSATNITMFQHTVDYAILINNQRICDIFSSRILVLCLIHSTAEDIDRRKAIRHTWAELALNNTGEIRYAFVFGFAQTEQDNLDILEESKIHNDILQLNFQESYKNLTIKTMLSLKWTIKFCPRTKFVMKLDDDVWVDTPWLMRHIEGLELTHRIMYGSCFPETQQFKVIRDPLSKFYTSFEEYSDFAYPSYCAGYAYFCTLNVARDIVSASANIKYLPWEDVYVGLCLKSLGYGLKKIREIFDFRRKAQEKHPWCLFRSRSMILHHVSVLHMYTLSRRICPEMFSDAPYLLNN